MGGESRREKSRSEEEDGFRLLIIRADPVRYFSGYGPAIMIKHIQFDNSCAVFDRH